MIKLRKGALFFLILFITTFFSFGTENSSNDEFSKWVLASTPFLFTQKLTKNSPEVESAKVLPQLILENISTNTFRTIPQSEQLDRKLETLLKARLSLFLELSKEIKVRDSIVLKDLSSYEFEKQILEEDKKIQDIQKQINDNLSEQNKEFEKNKMIQRGRRNFNDNTERISLYKDKHTELYSFNTDTQKESDTDDLVVGEQLSYSNYYVQNQLINAKINGLITGSITIYGEYISVTAEMFVYPGGKSTGMITEVGLLSDLSTIARNISFRLSPKIADSIPVELTFAISPEETLEDCSMMIDGISYPSIPDKVICHAGIHTISIECEGYNRETFNYSFTQSSSFKVEVNLQKSQPGVVNLNFKKPVEGLLFTNGELSGVFDFSDETKSKESIPVKVNGKTVLGHFESKDGEVVFFYIPEKLSEPDKSIVANVKVFNVSQNIEKRRRLMYISYSSLIMSLPFLFYSYGNYMSSLNAYNLGYTNSVNYEDVNKYRNYSFATIGLSVSCGIWFAVELVLYLNSVNKALPVKAKENMYDKTIISTED